MKNSTTKTLLIIAIMAMLSSNIYSQTLEYKATKFTEKTHEYLSYGILGLTALIVYSGMKSEFDPDGFDVAKHSAIGYALAGTSLVSAIAASYAYREDLFDFSDGITKKHIHATLGIIATGLMVYSATTEDHKIPGMLAGGFVIASYSITLF
jgi:hypothetical protein